MDMPATPGWTPTREAGLARLEAFAPRMGKAYASRRNHDLGPGRHESVSCLSPWVRRRLVTERELVGTALAHHTASASEKFVQEVFWRTYFKGWLENRPSVWDDYRGGLEADLAALGDDRREARRVAEAEEGRTGLDCFDAWVEELVETGYLHNHARMWFASIWIFTLGLPWRVGADFFLRHLLDGDPASNTLGWRWVAGLHTRGKNYAAQAWNIARFTGGRFRPDSRALNEKAAPLENPDGLPPVCPPRLPDLPERGRPAVLLVTEEDCRAEGLALPMADIRAVGTLDATAERSPRPVAGHVAAFDRGALADAGTRLRAAGLPEAEPLVAGSPDRLADWAARHGASQIVTPFVPRGGVKDWLDRAAPALDRAGIRFAEIPRDWDMAVWPHATAGFFKVKQKIPSVLAGLGFR